MAKHSVWTSRPRAALASCKSTWTRSFREKVDQATKSDTQKVLELQDQVAVLRKKNQEPSKRASSGDPRAVQKVQGSLQEKEQEIESLKKELNDARERIHELRSSARHPSPPSLSRWTPKRSRTILRHFQRTSCSARGRKPDLRVKLVEAETELKTFKSI